MLLAVFRGSIVSSLVLLPTLVPMVINFRLAAVCGTLALAIDPPVEAASLISQPVEGMLGATWARKFAGMAAGS